MAIQKLGKVSIMAKGNYISSEVYEKLDLVTFNGASYLCKKTCSGIEPIPGADTEYWQPFGQSVVVASQDKTGIVRPDGTSIVIKDSVTGRIGIGDAEYVPFSSERMSANNVSDALIELDTRLDVVQESISDVWSSTKTYAVGDYCIHNNVLWKCKVQHTNQTPTEGTYWTYATVANEIASVNSGLNSVNSSLSSKAASNHNHDDRYYTETEVNNLLNGKAASNHNHDDRYYTETEVNNLLNGKAASNHNHDSTYQAKGSYAAANHNHDSTYQAKGSYAAANHTHNYAAASHNHDDRYCTRPECLRVAQGTCTAICGSNVFYFDFLNVANNCNYRLHFWYGDNGGTPTINVTKL